MSINPIQKKIIMVGIGIIILMGLFPPWTNTFHYKTAYSKKPAGYAFILTPPKKRAQSIAYGIELDVTRLIVQWMIIFMATGLVVMLTATKHKGT